MLNIIRYSLCVVMSVALMTFNVQGLVALEDHKQASHTGPECLAIDTFFADEVWAKVGERTCLKCHNVKGDASDSNFLLRDTESDRTKREQAMQANRAAFHRIAKTMEREKSLLLQKVAGDLDHGGGEVCKPDSTELRILERFVRRATGQEKRGSDIPAYDAPPFFEGIEMISGQRLLRRLSLQLAGRLPSENEVKAVDVAGIDAIDGILDRMMKEEAFYERLRETFNDILLTDGYDGNAETAFSYEHFNKSRLWYQQLDPNRNRKKEERLSYSTPEMKKYYKLVREYRQAMRREPLELIAHLVRNELPFTGIVTADYIMVSPYTSKGYGIFEDVKDRFEDVEDPFEFIPVKISALTDDRSGKVVQTSETGFYPHAGILTTFQYLKRYPTTETNRNRLRVRMYFEHFLDVDILQLAPRVNDAAAITAKYEIPTMQAADCVVCHKTLDPIAGLFQDFYVVDGKGI